MKKFLPKTLNNPKGFTLVELLVVISIIAILSVIGITIFTGTQKGARDAKRRADIDALAKAYEVNYLSTSPHYQLLTAANFAGGAIPSTDPQGQTYSGLLSAAADAYTICASLESANGNASNNSGNAASGPTATFYCLKNRQ